MRTTLIFLFLIGFGNLLGQDPHFSQFYTAPLAINPANAGVYVGVPTIARETLARISTNFRRQWIASNAPYKTATFSADGKILGNVTGENNTLGVGFMAMNDNTLNGAFKSNYFSGSLAYHTMLDKDGNHNHYFGAGIMGTYGDSRINYSNISFGNQFASGGFNLALPNGERNLNDLKPFVSVGVGLLYQYKDGDAGSYFNVGFSGYHLNAPKLSALGDEKQILPRRLSGQISWLKYLTASEDLFIQLSGIYQQQAAINYILGGFYICKRFGEDPSVHTGAGVWYRHSDAVCPYLSVALGPVSAAFSYDVTISALKNGLRPANSMEFSLQFFIASNRSDAF